MNASGVRIVLITSDHRRHNWVAGQLASSAELVGMVAESKPAVSSVGPEASGDVKTYFRARDEAELKWFSGDLPIDCARRAVAWGGSNSVEVYDYVSRLSPDLVVLFGSSIIKEPMLGRFKGCIVNMHLGLSPYYRGSATNFWPLVDNLPECVGVTIHHATPAVDGGAILAQVRPLPSVDDTSHDLGCKAIIAGCGALVRLVASAEKRALPTGMVQKPGGRLCRRRDFTPEAVRRLNANFAAGMLPLYLARKNLRDNAFPIYSVQD